MGALYNEEKAVHYGLNQSTNNFGIEIPRSDDSALAIDRETQTDFGQKAIEKEMHHVRVAFTILEEGAPEPTGSKRIPCHIVFDTSLILHQA